MYKRETRNKTFTACSLRWISIRTMVSKVKSCIMYSVDCLNFYPTLVQSKIYNTLYLRTLLVGEYV